MANCSPHCASTCPLPADLRSAMNHAQSCKFFTSGAGTSQAENIEGCCRAMMSALGSDSIISIDLDDIRSLLGQGCFSLGYGQTFVREGAIIKACKASVQGHLIENPDLLRTATGILVIIRTPKNAAIKLSEVRAGLHEIWQHIPDAAQRIYTCIHADSLTDIFEAYTLVMNNKNQKASNPQLGIAKSLTLDDALRKISRLAEETDADRILLQSACQILATHPKSSKIFIQRKLKIGYSLASNLLRKLEHEGIAGPFSPEERKPVLA